MRGDPVAVCVVLGAGVAVGWLLPDYLAAIVPIAGLAMIAAIGGAAPTWLGVRLGLSGALGCSVGLFAGWILVVAAAAAAMLPAFALESMAFDRRGVAARVCGALLAVALGLGLRAQIRHLRRDLPDIEAEERDALGLGLHAGLFLALVGGVAFALLLVVRGLE